MPAVPLRKAAGGKDTGGNHEHALSAFIHVRSIVYSLFIRHKKIPQWISDFGICTGGGTHRERRRTGGTTLQSQKNQAVPGEGAACVGEVLRGGG